MGDLKRRRNPNASPQGLADPGVIGDAPTRDLVSELQENVRRLYGRLAAVQPAGETVQQVTAPEMRLQEGAGIRITKRGHRYIITCTVSPTEEYEIEVVDELPELPGEDDAPRIIHYSEDNRGYYGAPGAEDWQPLWGDSDMEVVDQFPALPAADAAPREIYHTPSGQKWFGAPGATKWRVVSGWTTYEGDPD